VLAARLGRWGVDESKQVVVYDDSFGAMAARMWWLLRWLGHDAVALLDGGLPKWMREGGTMAAELPAISPAIFQARPDDTMWVGSAHIEQALPGYNGKIIDARAEERFAGDIEPLDRVAGHIPGALNLPFEDNMDMGGSFLSPDELRELYTEAMGGRTPQEIIHMCGSGVTACHNLLAMELAGLRGAKLYPGSWSEWITVETRPIAVGGGELCE
jgi:thiosulfate/3-mercaptopyruvate sulfurtransferase